ncbi:methylthioribulose 1-phosphate dehydratase [Sphingomonas sp. SFZ2018-12]|uniref:methylthioribulose 1-phosphate dehydratase n=1 Tax=Sphingomonas sp. SFZ2018-12 TaxID=2683197 RepID=UPI001F0D6BCE|nr:methylthioribulose 1-phosphate dehydratase [Sphingomonas sp. SFZ2018-12]
MHIAPISPPPVHGDPTALVVDMLIAAGARLDARGLAAATSGNYSARLADGNVLVTRSGRHKGRLTRADFMALSPEGVALEAGRPSAEAALHLMLYEHFQHAGAILHWHSPSAVALSRAVDSEEWVIEGHEMLKAFPGVDTHATRRIVPIVDNSQDMAVIDAAIRPRLYGSERAPVFLIRGHGAYAWGVDVAEAERVSEAVEWLVAAELAERQWHVTREAQGS